MNRELLRMEHIITTISSQRILNQARLNLFEGEVIGIVGMNNAGKTTLVGGICGSYPITSGSIYLSEERMHIDSIEAGRKAGVYYFSINSSLISDVTIWENFLVGTKSGYHFIDKKLSKTKCREMLDLLGITVSINEKISYLSLKDKILVEMARAVYYEAKILILDDIITSFSATALEEMKPIFQRLCLLNIGIILIDNSIRHLKQYCHRLFVMREGKTVAVLREEDMDDNFIISLMLGTKPSKGSNFRLMKTETWNQTTTLLEMKEVCYKGVLKKLSFEIYQGEILGILNVGKHSGTAIRDLLQGDGVPDSGSICFKGQPIQLSSIKEAIRAGISFFHHEKATTVPSLTVEENIMLPALKLNSRRSGIVNHAELKYKARELISQYIVSSQGFFISEYQLRQSRILRWKISFCQGLSTDPDLIVLSDPTRLIDVTAKPLLYKDILSIKERGHAALIISSDDKELFAVCDRIIVVNQGRAEHVLHSGQDSYEQLLYLYSQHLKDI